MSWWDYPDDDSYAAACRRAARRQGLYPVSEYLTREGIDHRIDQTGGMCMVLYVPCPDGREIGVTNDGPWLVYEYDFANVEYDEGFELVTHDDFAAAMRVVVTRVRDGWAHRPDDEWRARRYIVNRSRREGLWRVYRLDTAKRQLKIDLPTAEAARRWADGISER